MNCPQILYEDAYFIAVNKPNNMLVHHSYYARNLKAGQSLVEWYKNVYNSLAHPIHRLDYKTSGIILLCKDTAKVRAFQKLFDDNTLHKTYLALLRGHIQEEGIICTPVKDENGIYKEAETHFKLLAHYTLNIAVEPFPTSRYSLAELIPKTGRMHQLRIHANKISHPIIGDTRYGNRHHNKMFAEKLLMPDLFLHAQKIEFTHPFLNIPINIEAPLPEFWNGLSGLV